MSCPKLGWVDQSIWVSWFLGESVFGWVFRIRLTTFYWYFFSLEIIDKYIYWASQVSTRMFHQRTNVRSQISINEHEKSFIKYEWILSFQCALSDIWNNDNHWMNSYKVPTIKLYKSASVQLYKVLGGFFFLFFFFFFFFFFFCVVDLF